MTNDFDKWDYRFDKYILSNFSDSPQIIADYYTDQVIELKLSLKDMIANDDDPGIYYEVEEYEDLLNKIVEYSEYIPTDELNTIKDWLKEKIVFQKDWEINTTANMVFCIRQVHIHTLSTVFLLKLSNQLKLFTPKTASMQARTNNAYLGKT